MEVESEVKTVLVKMKCEKCGEGFMGKDGSVVFPSFPPQFPHKCNNCGHIENYTKQYPYVKYLTAIHDGDYLDKDMSAISF